MMFEKKKSFLDLRFGRGNILMAAYIKVLDSHALYLTSEFPYRYDTFIN
jgi:hypothetical protein